MFPGARPSTVRPAALLAVAEAPVSGSSVNETFSLAAGRSVAPTARPRWPSGLLLRVCGVGCLRRNAHAHGGEGLEEMTEQGAGLGADRCAFHAAPIQRLSLIHISMCIRDSPSCPSSPTDTWRWPAGTTPSSAGWSPPWGCPRWRPAPSTRPTPTGSPTARASPRTSSPAWWSDPRATGRTFLVPRGSRSARSAISPEPSAGPPRSA